MQKLPDIIRGVEIKYFRSITTARVRGCSRFNVITGPNDVGKSNLLRALNLFFNETDQDGDDIIFEDEFSQKRLEQVRRESVKGKQFIQITVEFNRGPFFLHTLPERFRVTKTWYRDRLNAEQADDLVSKIKAGKVATTITKARSSLTRFLNRIEFRYIPAIKDHQTFSDVLESLQSAMFESSEREYGELTEQIGAFNKALESQATELRLDFSRSTGIDARISLPSAHGDLFQAFRIKTDGIAGEAVSLDQRGDGIRVRFIPAILNYICEKSSGFQIWGFEEPENSMEFKRAFELCETMRNSYSRNAQIFVTTHSPAFIDLSKSNQTLYIARKVDDGTIFDEVNSKTAQDLFSGDAELGIAEELGHVALLGKLHVQLQDAMNKAKAVLDTKAMLESEIESMRRPIILTEGKTDAMILAEAWKRLRDGEPAFSIKPCDTLPLDDKNEAGGASVLAGALKTIRPDYHQITIGLFDRDDEGIKSFALDKNYLEVASANGIKAHKNGKGYALLLPYPENRQNFVDVNNLTIEFLFDEKYLRHKVGGRGLSVAHRELVTLFNGKKIKLLNPTFLSTWSLLRVKFGLRSEWCLNYRMTHSLTSSPR